MSEEIMPRSAQITLTIMQIGLIIALGTQLISNYNNSPTARNLFFDDGERVLNGYYNQNDEFYCVWIGNRTDREVMHTEIHEACHFHTRAQKDHFCGWAMEDST